MAVPEPPPAGPLLVAAVSVAVESGLVAGPELVAADPLPAEPEPVVAGLDPPDPLDVAGAEPGPSDSGTVVAGLTLAPAVADLALADLVVVDVPLGADPLAAGNASPVSAAGPLMLSGLTVAAVPTLPPGRAEVTIGAPAASRAPLPAVASVSGRASTPAGADSVGFPVVCSASPVGRTEPATGGATSWDTGLLNTL
ncbi:MAG TPA: hypothetical protein VK659_20510, partial [Asanoa sp.]|nr:hypothetical protein [Asanoa sp.]